MKSILTIALLLLLCGPAQAGGDGGTQPLTEADTFAVQLIASLRSAYAGIERERESGTALELMIQFDLAIQDLTSLAQLFGMQWADERLRAIYRAADCPDLHMGYSPDGRLLLRVEPMELKNPDFAEYRFYLCTLESLHEADIHTQAIEPLRIELLDGTVREAQAIEPGHPLWEKLNNQAGSYMAPSTLVSGQNLVFKQVYAAKALGRDAISAVSLDWDDYQIRLIWFENEVVLD